MGTQVGTAPGKSLLLLPPMGGTCPRCPTHFNFINLITEPEKILTTFPQLHLCAGVGQRVYGSEGSAQHEVEMIGGRSPCHQSVGAVLEVRARIGFIVTFQEAFPVEFQIRVILGTQRFFLLPWSGIFQQ